MIGNTDLPLYESLARLKGEYSHKISAHERQRVGVLVEREAGLAAEVVLQRQRSLARRAAPPRLRVPVQLQVHAVCTQYSIPLFWTLCG